MLPVLMDYSPETQVALTDLITNPDYYLWRFDGPDAIFARMDRASYKKSIFTDQRIIALDPKPIRVDLEALMHAFQSQQTGPSKPSFIFHVAHCGSTLLARALDLETQNIVYREPLILRQLSVLLVENNWGFSPPDTWKEVLKLSTTLLARSYIRNTPAIIKANVPVNFIIDKLVGMYPDTRGLLLYATFDNYLLSILKSDGHRQWVSEITTVLGRAIEQQIGISQIERKQLSLAQTAASLWLAQISIYDEVAQKYNSFKTLDSELFFSKPVPVLAATFDFFENSQSPQDIDAIVQSELFSKHAKIPDQQYDNERRLTEKKQLMRSMDKELKEAREWSLAIIENMSLSERLSDPLLGESPELFEKVNNEATAEKREKKTSPGMFISEQHTATAYLSIFRDEKNNLLSDIDDEIIITGLKQKGAILFRGFGYDIDSFTAFVKRFCTNSIYNPSLGREIVDEDNNIQTVDLGEEAFPLHAELSREPWRPDVCFFACESAPELGGETNLCDGVKIVDALDEDVINQLQSQALIYFQPMLAGDCRQWLGTEKPTMAEINNPPDGCPFQLTYLDGKLTRSFITPALHYTMFGRQLAFGNFLLFSRYGLNNRLQPCFLDGTIVPDGVVAEVKRVSDALTVSHRWEKGDLLMLDNTRFLHGRNTILNLEQRRIISYFGYLKFAELDAIQASAVWRERTS